MAVTKLTKPKAEYHVWADAELNNGDILGIYESLGRKARTVTLDSTGISTVRFNVVQDIYGNHEQKGNTFIPDAAFFTSPILMDSVEITGISDDIVIQAGDSQTWTRVSVRDVKIVTASGLIVTVE